MTTDTNTYPLISGDWLHISSTGRVRLPSIVEYWINDTNLHLVTDGRREISFWVTDAKGTFYGSGVKAALDQLDRYFLLTSTPNRVESTSTLPPSPSMTAAKPQ